MKHTSSLLVGPSQWDQSNNTMMFGLFDLYEAYLNFFQQGQRIGVDIVIQDLASLLLTSILTDLAHKQTLV